LPIPDSNPLASADKSTATISAPPFQVKYDWQNDSFIIICVDKFSQILVDKIDQWFGKIYHAFGQKIRVFFL